MLAVALTLAASLRPTLLSRPLWREIRPAADLGGPAAPWPSGGGGHPVLVIPGFMAGDASMWPLAAALAAHGHRPVPSGIRSNVDCSAATLRRLLDRLERVAERHGGPVAIVGHSRGGLLGRALAAERPDLVSALVALGAPHRAQLALHPVILGQALALGILGSLGVDGLVRLDCHGGTCCRRFDELLAEPVPAGVRFLSLYSRADGVVDWRACLDADGRHREVASTHCGMVASTEVLGHVLATLADLPAERSVSDGQQPDLDDAAGRAGSLARPAAAA
jgi:triacylglycerol lipase